MATRGSQVMDFLTSGWREAQLGVRRARIIIKHGTVVMDTNSGARLPEFESRLQFFLCDSR